MGVAADFVNRFSTPLETFMTEGVTKLASAVSGPLYVGATLYILIFGIVILLGYVRAPISDFVINVIRIAIIITLATKADVFNEYVKDLFFTQLPDGISTAIGHVSQSGTDVHSVSNGKAFDDVGDQIFKLSDAIYSQWEWDDWYPLVVVVLALFGLIPIAALLGIILLAKVGLTLTLVLGPVFIALYLFNATKSFTSSWIGVLVNFVVLQILSMTFITLLLSILTKFVDDARSLEGTAQLEAGVHVLMVYVLALMLAIYLPAISSQLAGGGFQIGTGLFNSGVNAAHAAAGKTAMGASGMMSLGKATWYKMSGGRSGGSIEKG